MAYVKVPLVRQAFLDQSDGAELPLYHLVEDSRAYCGAPAPADPAALQNLEHLFGCEGEHFQVCSACKAALVRVESPPPNPASLRDLAGLFADFGLAAVQAKQEPRDLSGVSRAQLRDAAVGLWEQVRWLCQLADPVYERYTRSGPEGHFAPYVDRFRERNCGEYDADLVRAHDAVCLALAEAGVSTRPGVYAHQAIGYARVPDLWHYGPDGLLILGPPDQSEQAE